MHYEFIGLEPDVGAEGEIRTPTGIAPTRS